MTQSVRIGLDVGATNTHAVAVRGTDRRVLAEVTHSTGYGNDGLTRTLHSVIDDVRTPLDDHQIESIGVGVPGLVNRLDGTVSHAVNVGVDFFPIADVIRNHVAVPVYVENDVNVAALGAASLYNALDSLAFLNIGTGIAAGFVTAGKLHSGTHGSAGEIGHYPVRGNDTQCSCGQVGCLETVASGSGIAHQWNTTSPTPEEDLIEHARSGDAIAVAILEELARGIASAIELIAVTWDPAKIALGGGMTTISWPVESDVQRILADRARSSAFVETLQLPERVVVVPPELAIAPRGAALLSGSTLISL